MKEAKRYNSGKAKLGYFARSFHKALEAIARVKEFGATKYAEDNWKLGNKPDSEYLDSMARHLDAFQQGEAYDRDSGCHHLGHAIWNLCALFELNHGKVDVINEPLFESQIKHWAEKKKESDKLPDTPMATPGETVMPRKLLKEFSQNLKEINEKIETEAKAIDKLNGELSVAEEGIVDILYEESLKILEKQQGRKANESNGEDTSGCQSESPGEHPYVDGNGNPLSLKRAFEMKAAGMDVFNRIPDEEPNPYDAQLARDEPQISHSYTTGIGTPISPQEAFRRQQGGLSVKVKLDVLSQTGEVEHAPFRVDGTQSGRCSGASPNEPNSSQTVDKRRHTIPKESDDNPPPSASKTKPDEFQIIDRRPKPIPRGDIIEYVFDPLERVPRITTEESNE